MIILDANVLIYAYNQDAPQHVRATTWLEGLFSGSELIGLPWTTLWAFLRICTNPRALPKPMPPKQAFGIINDWLSRPEVRVIQPGPRHSELLEKMIAEGGATGALASDAVLAALALENGATLASTDRDFSRIPGLRWMNPLG